MARVTLRFYEELNDRLPASRRKTDFAVEVPDGTTVKQVVESAGVSIDQVDLVLSHGSPVTPDHVVRDGDRLSVYPVFERLDVGDVTRVRAQPLRDPRFVLDVHLGRLARHLRLLGFDCLYRNDFTDEDLLRISEEERRVLLSRDTALVTRSGATRALRIRSAEPGEQLREVVDGLDLARAVRPFTRCLECNEAIESVEKATILARLEPRTRQHYDAFWTCRRCDRIYWRGSHYERLLALVGRVRRGP